MYGSLLVRTKILGSRLNKNVGPDLCVKLYMDPEHWVKTV